jgi:hypothetical protein
MNTSFPSLLVTYRRRFIELRTVIQIPHTRSKREKMALFSVKWVQWHKKLLHSKGNNYQSEETAYRMGENLCPIFIQQEANVQNI